MTIFLVPSWTFPELVGSILVSSRGTEQPRCAGVLHMLGHCIIVLRWGCQLNDPLQGLLGLSASISLEVQGVRSFCLKRREFDTPSSQGMS